MRWKITGLYVGSLLILSLLLLCIFVFTIWFSIIAGVNVPETERSRFPEQFTLEFEKFIMNDNGMPTVKKEGEEKLKEFNAWLQILDKNGTEIANWGKPDEVNDHYTPSELIFNYKYSNNGNTIFVSRKNVDNKEWSYVIGFPENRVSKYTVLFSPESLGYRDLITPLVIILLTVIIIGYLFGKKLSRPVLDIINGITKLAKGHYHINYKAKGLYKNVYYGLNTLASTLHYNQRERRRLENMQEEWIANLSHDLKTPLSSIKGYGEVLSDEKNISNTKEVAEYANIIMNKSLYIESLIEDLKLTYQLKNNMLPLNKKNINLVELLRTIIIAILNTPQYREREIHFDVNTENIPFYGDAKWLTRAFNNLIFNALTHNSNTTEIWVSVNQTFHDTKITIKDNGKGIPAEDLDNLFERYYRGTNTNRDNAGTGLGMAIAKQIITSHEGTISVESSLNKGTCISIIFTNKTNL